MSIVLTGSNPPYEPLLFMGLESWELPGWVATSGTAPDLHVIAPARYMFRIPICVAKPTTYDRIGVYVGHGRTGKVARLGIMSHAPEAGPLLWDFGTVEAETDSSVAAITINPGMILAGYYDILLVSDLDPTGLLTSYGFGSLAGYVPAFGSGVYSSGALPGGAFSGASTTDGSYVAGGFPSTIPKLDGTYLSAADALPLISLRRAA